MISKRTRWWKKDGREKAVENHFWHFWQYVLYLDTRCVTYYENIYIVDPSQQCCSCTITYIFFWRKKSQPPKVHFYSISKQMILPPWSSPANPSSSEGTCPKFQRRHTRTQHVDEEEEEDRKQRKSSLSSPLPGHSLLHLHLPTSGRSSTFSGKTLGLSLAPATTPLWNFGLYHCIFYINELLFCKNILRKDILTYVPI